MRTLISLLPFLWKHLEFTYAITSPRTLRTKSLPRCFLTNTFEQIVCAARARKSRSSTQKQMQTHLSSLLTGPLCPASGGLVRADIWLSGALGSPSGSQTTWGRRYRFCLCLAERGRGWVMKARQVWFCPPCCNHRERRLQSVRNAFEMETFEEVSERKRVFEALSAFFPPPFPPLIFFAYLKY